MACTGAESDNSDNSFQLPACSVGELSMYQTLPLLCPTALLWDWGEQEQAGAAP